MAVDPHCWYCGMEVFDYTGIRADGSQITGWMPTPDTATVDHLRTKARYGNRPKFNDEQTVLCCSGCNHLKGTISVALMKLRNGTTIADYAGLKLAASC